MGIETIKSGQIRASTGKHLDYLDSLRGIAALLVVLSHALLTVPALRANSQNNAPAFWIFQHGHHAVCLFIILSGFCLILPTLSNGFQLSRGSWAFFKRRAWRIIPPYYCALLLSLFLIVFFIHNKTGTHWDDSLPVNGHAIFTHILLIQDIFPDDFSKINHAFWSISVEWRIYFIFPILLLGWRLWGPVLTTAIAILSGCILYELSLYYFHSTFTFQFLGLFGMGMLAGAVSFSSNTTVTRYQGLPWGWITVFMAIAYGIVRHNTRECLNDTAFGFFTASLLVFVSIHPENWIHRLLRFRPLVFTGTFAYSIYLIHAPLLQIFWQYLFFPLQSNPMGMFSALILIGVPLIIAASYLFYIFCEYPFFKRR